MDPNDFEGGVPGEICEQGVQGKNVNTPALVSEDPNSIKIRIPISHLTCSSQTIQTVGTDVSGSTLEVTTSSAMDTINNIGGCYASLSVVRLGLV
jgi:hypothetical protein